MPEMPEMSRSTPSTYGQDRRVSPRSQVDGHVLARLMGLNVQVDMRDVSTSGFQLASPVPVVVGDVHEVRAVTAAGLVCTLRARVVRCVPPSDSDASYISGWEASPDENSSAALAAIVDSLSARPLAFHTGRD
jgi:hypothetical protein